MLDKQTQPKIPIQKILFGSPGTGKSHRVEKEIIPKELKIKEKENIIKTVFHPEYTYGDFMGKLMPHTKGGKVEYKYYSGHFLQALAQAYKNYIEDKENPQNVILVIDEINRGNSSAIFGTVFQLLDRDDEGWSSYFINVTELEMVEILNLIGVKTRIAEIKTLGGIEYEYKFLNQDHWVKDYITTFQPKVDCVKINLQQRRIYLPPNLSIVATMNTSDNSIYFMDSAFKRRWDWEFVDIKADANTEVLKNRKIVLDDVDKGEWVNFVNKLNEFIVSKYNVIRKIEDKQIGYFFINEEIITKDHIKNKLMFFVWDSVFTNNKKPLAELLGVEEKNLVTFGQFAEKVEDFVTEINR